MLCSAGKPLVLALMWMPLEFCGRPSPPCHGKGTDWWQWYGRARIVGCMDAPPRIGLGPDWVRHGQAFWGRHVVYQGIGGRSQVVRWGIHRLDLFQHILQTLIGIGQMACNDWQIRRPAPHLEPLCQINRRVTSWREPRNHNIYMNIRTQDFPAEHCIVTRCSMVLTYNRWSFSCIVHFTCLTKITEKVSGNWTVITFAINPSTDYFCWLISAQDVKIVETLPIFVQK